MNDTFVPFDDLQSSVAQALEAVSLDEAKPLYIVRNLFGIVTVSVADRVRENEEARRTLRSFSSTLQAKLGAHGASEDESILFVAPDLLSTLDHGAHELHPGIYWVDRMVTGHGWWTVDDATQGPGPTRWTLFSVKGGVGRSTSATVLAWHLARRGERVLVVDLDLESPGLSSTMLDDRTRPELGVTDWFVEELVGQGDRVIERMTGAPAWTQDSDGSVHVAPAHGRKPGEYLAKLGRVYMDTGEDRWTARLSRLLDSLEARFTPSIVLLESRSGLHDIAAATVTDLNAEVLLFALDAQSHWTGCDILFKHWSVHGLAPRIRERLSIVSALTPEVETTTYLESFQEQAWNLFRDRLYDDIESPTGLGSEFSFDLGDEDAPHIPIPIIWNRGLAAGTSLRNPEAAKVPIDLAFTQFLVRFDQLLAATPTSAPR